MAHPWPVFPPEANYTAITSGAGPAPMLAYGDVLLGHFASTTAVAAVSQGNAVGTFASWQGSGAASAAVANVGLNTQALALADVAMAKAEIAHQAAAAHTATVAKMVPHVQATANPNHHTSNHPRRRVTRPQPPSPPHHRATYRDPPPVPAVPIAPAVPAPRCLGPDPAKRPRHRPSRYRSIRNHRFRHRLPLRHRATRRCDPRPLRRGRSHRYRNQCRQRRTN
jgi:hypothetical protein